VGPRAFGRTLRLGIIALLAATCAVLVYQGWAYAARAAQQTTPVTQIPFTYVYAALPIGFALMLLHVLAIARSYVGSGAFDISEDVAPADANAL
jgi:TRAP-type transport system small permease protein